MADVDLVPATLEHLALLEEDRAAFAELIGSPVPDGWPEFPESIEFSATRLREHPDESAWWMHFFIWQPGRVLVGSGGFVGPPADGTAEIGYEIAPEFRGKGLATAAAEAMVAKARRSGVHTVIAHTLAADNPSTAVLRRAGFVWAGEQPDLEQGVVWRWTRSTTL